MGLGLLLQWAWINMAALRSLRQRVRSTQLKLERELAAFSKELSDSGFGNDGAMPSHIQVLQDAVSDVFTKQGEAEMGQELLGIRNFISQHPRPKAAGSLRAAGGESVKEPSEPSQLRERWDWVELALWDFSQGVREYRVRWKSWGTSVLGTALGYRPVRDFVGLEPSNLT